MAPAPETPVEDDAARRYALEGFPLQFHMPEAEAEYRRKWLSTTRAAHKLWTGASYLYYVAISLGLLWAAEPGFAERQWFRFAFCLPFLTLVLFLILTERYSARSYNPLFLITTLALYGNAVYAYTFGPIADMRLHMFEFALLFVFSHCFYPAHWGAIALFSLLATPLAVGGFVTADQGPQGALVPLEMILTVTLCLAATCLFASYSREVLLRRNFRQLRILAEGKARSERLAAAAGRAAAARKRFLSLAAHELRTPLNGMIGFAELGGAFATAEGASVRGSNPFPALEREARHLSRLVEATLTVTAEGNSGLVTGRRIFDLDPLLTAIAADHNRSGTAIDLQLEGQFGTSLSILGDPDLYRVVIDSQIQQIVAVDNGTGPLVMRTVQLNRYLIIEIGRPRTGDAPGALPPPRVDDATGTERRCLIDLLLDSQNLRIGSATDSDNTGFLRVLVPMGQVRPKAALSAQAAVRAAG